jgi:integrase
MAIYRHPETKNWWISIYRGVGRPRLQVSSGTADEATARAVEASLRLAHRGNVPRDRLVAAIDNLMGHAAAGMPLAMLWDAYAASPAATRIARRSLSNRRFAWQKFAAFMASRHPRIATADGVTRQMCQEFLDGLPVAGKTVNNTHNELSGLFTAMRDRAGLAANPWADLQRRENQIQHGRAFTREEEPRILTACRGQHEWYELSMVARWTGLRLGDCLTLRGEDIADGWIRITPSKTQRHGTRAVIPIHPALAPVLATLPSTGPLFPYSLPRRDHRIIRLGYAPILAAAGVTDTTEGRVSFHSWRHTFRTRLAEAGVSNDVARKLGGWTTDVAERVYDHDLTQLQRAIAAMK